MKNGYLCLALLVLTTIMSSCSKKDSTPELLPNENFGRASTIAFYLFDEKGTNLVEKYGATFGISYPQDTVANRDYTRDIDLVTDTEGRRYLHIFFRGFKNSLTSRFDLTIPQHNTDRVEIKYKLQTEGVIGGSFVARIEWMLYNGVKVYSETDGKTWPGIIVVTKKADRTTVATKF